MNCPFTSDGPCYYRKPGGVCGRPENVECLKPYRDGVKVNEDVLFLRGTAALFRNSDPNRCERLEEIAGRLSLNH